MKEGLFSSGKFARQTTRRLKRAFSWLRSLERKKAILGGWDTGPLLLAEAGLMDGRRMALHWQTAPVVRDRYPRIDISSAGCQVEPCRFKGPGGMSTFDLMIAFIEQEASTQVAQMVAKSANWNLALGSDDKHPQGPGNPQLNCILAVMEAEIGAPSPIPDLAQRAGLSERQLTRLFRQHLHASPHQFQLRMRLQHAYELLRQSEMTISEIAAACGFTSLSRFSQAFRKEVGETPTDVRRRPRWLDLQRPTHPLGLTNTLNDERRNSVGSKRGTAV